MGQVFHIWNRGVDGRLIVLNRADRMRFLFALNAFNSIDPVVLKSVNDFTEVPLRKKLVSIIAYTLLDNHFHICLREERIGGLTTFMRKLGTGFTHYFNTRHERRGRLFESKTYVKTVTSDAYLQHLIAYIHLNVLDRTDKAWRCGRLTNWKEKKSFIEKYQWSSAQSYLKETANPIISLSAIKELLPASTARAHVKYLSGWSERNFTEVPLR